MTDGSMYVMSPMEIAWGYVPGHTGTMQLPSDSNVDPRTALERVVREALMRPPCGVAFSGGRDSSAVLAVATHVARRDGLPEPVPITRVFPDVPESEEGAWQEAVVRHLKLSDWHRVVVHDQLDIIGPWATPYLIEHGVLWPPTFAGDVPLAAAVPGGSVIDGEGGDEVLGVAAHRVAPLANLVRHPRPLRWRRLRSALGALAPASVRREHQGRRWREQPFTWLRPATRDALISALECDEQNQPLSFAASVRMVPRRRTQVLGAHNRRILSAKWGVDFSSPLLHRDFVHALARVGGVLGSGDRTDVLRMLLADLLPHEVIERTSKATFTYCYMGTATREFVATWRGNGLDSDLVDPDELQRLWLTGRPIALTAALLQLAWLARDRPVLS